MKFWPWRARVRVGSTGLRIGLAFSVLAILLFGGVGLLSANDARRQSERDTAAALQQLADRLALRLDADMAARYRDIAQLTELVHLLGLEPDGVQWREVIARLHAASPHYSWIGVADTDGRVRVATRGLLEKADVRQRPWFAQGLRRTTVGECTTPSCWPPC